MGLAPYIYADRRLPDEATVRETLAERTLTKFGDDERLERLHRVFYPVFRVTYRYETGEGKLFGTEEQTATALLDGLWADNDAALAQYTDGTAELVRRATNDYDFGVDTPQLGRSVLMQFQVPTGEAESLLPRRIEEYREQQNGTANVFLRKLRESYGLPGDFDPDGFDTVTEVERCYLPFWLAEFHSPHSEDIALVAFRDPDASAEAMRQHGWLSAFISEQPRRLATYSYEADPDRVERAIRERVGRSREEADGSRDDGGPTPTESEGAPTVNRERPSDDEPEVVQPDGVEMQAESVVDPDPDRSFADVGGMSELLETLNHKVVRPLADPEAFEEYGIGVVNGVLLHGPPGCGKTHVAGALAGEVDHAFIEVSPADVTSKYMGEPAQKVEELFAVARANAPCVLFIDEIDGIAGDRDGDSNMNSSEQQLVNQLLTELEGIAEEDVVVVGATNLVDDVDGAIRRSGRFDERVEVPPPDAAARRAILDLHLAGRPTAEDLDLGPIVEATAGYAASDLELLAENAARQALREDAPIGAGHLQAAADDSATSIPDWIDPADAAEGGVVQPNGVDLQATNLVEPEPGRDFTSVGGMEELKERLQNTVIDPVQNSEAYDEYGIDVLSGLLLYGPPGCGKTHLAGALAGELGHSFIEVTPADLSSKWMGEPASNVADLFEIARANAPCILFIDEIDGVAGSRRGSTSDNQQQLVNQLLTEVEGAAEHDVVTVGATNFVEDVDSALRRSGRFDERVEVPPPDARAREAILKIHLRDRPVADAVDWDAVVEPTAGYAASDIELLAEDAARQALRADSEIRQEHLETAVWETRSSIEDWAEKERYAEDERSSYSSR
ncbi:ATP-binding protein [Haloarcula sp. S1CR25-12]|uniref:ATP-binding protein n=1 Tax=Haloarcula saliterrae TaxID=2950534 RepID=A0ABU2F6A7_9EURY|nr:ATP-binding protein [Haloarcula sp. S1CR25-12]MDS0257807.1 ATP-binding protein [Haloarcula sp. S1CR25-12]